MSKTKTRNEIFQTLCFLGPERTFWKNKWMFTRDVFMNESRQMQDQEAFWLYVRTQPAELQRLIKGV